jgi:hypothetical protein
MLLKTKNEDARPESGRDDEAGPHHASAEVRCMCAKGDNDHNYDLVLTEVIIDKGYYTPETAR